MQVKLLTLRCIGMLGARMTDEGVCEETLSDLLDLAAQHVKEQQLAEEGSAAACKQPKRIDVTRSLQLPCCFGPPIP